MAHVCPRCGYATAHRGSFLRHLRRVRACPPAVADTAVPTAASLACQRAGTYACRSCSKLFLSQQSRCNHQRRCGGESQERRDPLAVARRENGALRARIRDLEAALAAAGRSAAVPAARAVALERFGCERIYHVTTNVEFLNACVQQPTQGVQSIIRAIHANAAHPEHRNLRAGNARLPYVHIFDAGGWLSVPTMDVVRRLVARSIDIMDGHYEESDAPASLVRYRQFCGRYDADDAGLWRELVRRTKCTLRSLGDSSYMLEL